MECGITTDMFIFQASPIGAPVISISPFMSTPYKGSVITRSQERDYGTVDLLVIHVGHVVM